MWQHRVLHLSWIVRAVPLRSSAENNFEFAVSSEKNLELQHKELIVKTVLNTDINGLVEENKDSINENSCINEEVSIMSESGRIPPLMQNSPKYWPSNIDKRWKGTNSSRGKQHYPQQHYHNIPHQNYQDRYNKQYSDKFNNGNDFNDRNNHFNKLRSDSRGTYNNQSKEAYNKKVTKVETDSLKIKSTNSELESTHVNHSIQENGVSNESQSKENISSLNNDQPINKNEKVNEKVDVNNKNEVTKKENEHSFNELTLSSKQIILENGNNSFNDILKHELVVENGIISDGSLIPSKNSDVSKTQSEEKSEYTLDNINKEDIECPLSTEHSVVVNVSSAPNDADLEKKENSKKSPPSESDKIDTHILDAISQNINKPEDLVKMDVDDDNIANNCNSKCTDSNQIETPNSLIASSMEINENIDKKNENLQSEKKTNDEPINESQKQLCNIIELDNKTLNEGVDNNPENITGVQSTDELSNKEKIEKIDEVMDVVSSSEITNSLSTTVLENKDFDSKNTSDKDEKSSISMVVDQNHSDQKEETQKTEINQEIEEKKELVPSPDDTKQQEKISNIIEEVDLVDDEPEVKQGSNDMEEDNLKTKIDSTNNALILSNDSSQTTVPVINEGDKAEESNEEGRAVVHKRRRRKRFIGILQQEISTNEINLENGVRQKRLSAKNAEEMIRKEILKNDEDDDSSDGAGKVVVVNYKKANSHAIPQSPPSLKRTLDDLDCVPEPVTAKKIKSIADISVTESQEKKNTPISKESIAETKELVRKISQEDIRGKLKKLKQEELEALLLQKIVECITIKGEMGKLREQARVSKSNQEATRIKCQQLQKQVEGFDMVLKRINYDKNTNNDKFVPPIKINRSVGLQVNFLSQDHGIQSLKQIQMVKASSNGPVVGVTPKTASTGSPGIVSENRSINQSPRKGLKVRSPRRPDVPTPALVPQTNSTATSSQTVVNNGVPHATIVMNKSADPSPKRTVTLPNTSNVLQLVPPGQQQNVIVNSTVGGLPSRPPPLTIQRAVNNSVNKTSDLIDLTDEEDKTKPSVITPITTAITSRFPRVLQAVPASVTLSSTTNLRVVQAGAQGPQPAVVNNSSRVAYVMQSGVNGGPARQILLTNSNTIRPVTTVSSRNISTINYKQGLPTLPNGTVRVLPMQAANTNAQIAKHPAPLPESTSSDSNPSWKLPPPAPSLKISKVPTGIVLSWNMTLSDKFAEIVSYQLYAYQEVAGTNPNAALWKKVGDVRALPLPMACTLTQFTEGNNYYFAVRAVDVHSRFGLYSKPGNISL